MSDRFSTDAYSIEVKSKKKLKTIYNDTNYSRITSHGRSLCKTCCPFN